jgi:ubiquinone biosynthesis monooxygenase Coq7
VSLLDPLIAQVDQALRTVFAQAPTVRPLPGAGLPEAALTDQERRHAAALMRVNHVGEVCAQALYAGQAFGARDTRVRKALERAAWEETEHLNWTASRIAELSGRKSLLNPLWYAGAWTIGVVAGCLGDAVSLGFLVETELQVEAHLAGHLLFLPATDARTRAVVEQMKADEVGHARMAETLGAAQLPLPARLAMKLAAKTMTTTAYWV